VNPDKLLLMQLHPLTLFVFALCAVLLVLVGLQWRRLQALRKNRLQELDLRNQATRKDLVEGLNTLLVCLIQEQIEVSEAGIRIKLHLDHLYPLEQQRTELQLFYEFYDRVKDFSTHGARRELTTQERFDQDRERYKLEEEYGERLKALAKKLYPLTTDAT
jgi:exopolyphosphatase/pppGpp-phosphohydrolase